MHPGTTIIVPSAIRNTWRILCYCDFSYALCKTIRTSMNSFYISNCYSCTRMTFLQQISCSFMSKGSWLIIFDHSKPSHQKLTGLCLSFPHQVLIDAFRSNLSGTHRKDHSCCSGHCISSGKNPFFRGLTCFLIHNDPAPFLRIQTAGRRFNQWIRRRPDRSDNAIHIQNKL